MNPLSFRGSFSNLINFITALREAIIAFLKAYDEELGSDPLGYPLLEQWERSPYEPYLDGSQKVPHQGPVRAALIFVKGRRPGEACYLRDGTYQLGTACDNDIMIHVTQPSEARLTLQVSEDGVIVSTSSSDTPVLINRHISQFAGLVDQDECSFNKAQFYYVALPTHPVKVNP